jgi:TolB protein
LQIEITEGATGTRPIAVVPFTWQGDGERPADIAAIIDDDLARSGQFAPMERRNMVAQPGSGDDIDFGSWRTLEVDHVVVGAIEPGADGRYRVRFQLFDVARQRQVTGYRYSAEGDALRGLAHTISDAIYEAITGERGAFATRVAFVSTGGPGQARAYRLRVADYDGSNARNVLASDEPVMSPAWSPDGERVAYVSFEDGRPAVFVQQVATGERRRVSQRAGINGAPAWSPDGERLALTLSHEGNPELYVLDLGTDELQRVTRNSGIDTSPAWMPSGEQIVFTSDRAGGPQLYKAAADGSGQAERLTFDGAYNADPDVGPNGARVAFVHRTRASQYRIAVLALESGRMRVVTEGRLDESPSFAPNGRMILYATEHQGRGVLGSVSVDGRAAARLSRAEGDVREPAWGPFRD